MNLERRLSIAAVRLAALRGLVAAGGEPSPAQLGRAARPLVGRVSAKSLLSIDFPSPGPGPRSLSAFAASGDRQGLVADGLPAGRRCR